MTSGVTVVSLRELNRSPGLNRSRHERGKDGADPEKVGLYERRAIERAKNRELLCSR